MEKNACSLVTKKSSFKRDKNTNNFPSKVHFTPNIEVNFGFYLDKNRSNINSFGLVFSEQRKPDLLVLDFTPFLLGGRCYTFD